MNLIEAVKTGKPIQRAQWHDSLTVQECTCQGHGRHSECPDPSLMFPGYVDPKLTVEDILADDWQVPPRSEPEKKE